MQRLMRALLAGVLVVCASQAGAQEKTGNRPGFSLKPGTVKIVLMRPTVRMGEQSTGGMNQPNAEWTAQARANLGQALRQAQGKLSNIVIEYQDTGSGDGALVSQYENLFGTVADSVLEFQFFPGNRLPTKKRKDTFDWGVGAGIAAVKSLNGGDYALFINTNDSYASAGRKALKIFSAMAGVSVATGVHTGHAGLIDLKTGDLVWLNADRQMGGDLRTPEGAAKRVAQLLEGFPGQTAPVPVAVK